jgi:hypothetical protein
MDQLPTTDPVVPNMVADTNKSHAHALWWIGGGIFVLVLIALAVAYYFMQPKTQTGTAQKVYHVGVLDALDYFSPAIDGFKQKMNELGYVEPEPRALTYPLFLWKLR